MDKLIVSGASVLTSLALAGFLPQSKPGDDPKPQAEEKVVTKTIVIEEADPADPAHSLRQAYDAIRRLRGLQLQDRPREMLGRAASIYRDAVKAHESDDAAKARGMAQAARELARAVELAHSADRPADADGDLPPPPLPKRAGSKPSAPVPPLPPQLPREVNVEVRAEGDVLVARTPDGEPFTGRIATLPGPEGQRRFVYTRRADGKPGEEKDVIVRAVPAEVEQKVREQMERATKQFEEQHQRFEKESQEARERLEEARKRVKDANDPVVVRLRRQLESVEARRQTLPRANAFVFSRSPMQVGGAAAARRVLEQAHDRITEARKSQTGDDAKFYLDAARDLYNAARRDAEAGRNERAIELATASLTLTRVPGYLSGDKEKDVGQRDKPEARSEPTRREVRIFRKEAEGERETKGEPKVERKREIRIERRKGDESARSEEGQRRVRVEVKEDDDKPGPEASTEPPPVGIGVALKFEDDVATVMELLPESPAAKDGRIEVGDVIVGIEPKGGETLKFEGKEPSEIVERLRGEPGTEVRVIVRPKGSDETKVVPLTRRKLPLPRRVEVREEVKGLAEPPSAEAEREISPRFRFRERGAAPEGRGEDEPKLPPPLP